MQLAGWEILERLAPAAGFVGGVVFQAWNQKRNSDLELLRDRINRKRDMDLELLIQTTIEIDRYIDCAWNITRSIEGIHADDSSSCVIRAHYQAAAAKVLKEHDELLSKIWIGKTRLMMIGQPECIESVNAVLEVLENVLRSAADKTYVPVYREQLEAAAASFRKTSSEAYNRIWTSSHDKKDGMEKI